MRIETVIPGAASGTRALTYQGVAQGGRLNKDPATSQIRSTSQVNEGARLPSPDDPARSGRTFAAGGTQTMSLTVAGVRHTLSLDLPLASTPQRAVTIMADTVRAARLGVTPRVETTLDRRVRIGLSSRPGVRNSFTVADRAGTIVSRTGANNRVVSATGSGPVTPTVKSDPVKTIGMGVTPFRGIAVSVRV